MSNANLYIGLESALHFWRTNPPAYVLEGAAQNIRALGNCPTNTEQIGQFGLSEAEFGPFPIHVLTPFGHARCGAGILKHHVQRAALPAHSLYPLRDGIHITSPELTFVQLCESLSLGQAAMLGMELCGTYAKRPGAPEDKATRDYRLMDAHTLCRHLGKWKSVHGLVKARRAAQFLVNAAASPMETVVYLLLCLPQRYGGYNLPRPELNAELRLSAQNQLILRKDKVFPDMLWRSAMLIVEYDGEYHNTEAQRKADEMRRTVLESMGYTVLQIKKQQLFDPVVFHSVALSIAQRLGKRVRPLTLKQELAREQLRRELLQNDQTAQSHDEYFESEWHIA